MAHPSLFTDWRQAKRGAAALANAAGATLLQTEAGKPRVILGKTVKTFQTWLSAWSWLHQVRKDQIGRTS